MKGNKLQQVLDDLDRIRFQMDRLTCKVDALRNGDTLKSIGTPDVNTRVQSIMKKHPRWYAFCAGDIVNDCVCDYSLGDILRISETRGGVRDAILVRECPHFVWLVWLNQGDDKPFKVAHSF